VTRRRADLWSAGSYTVVPADLWPGVSVPSTSFAALASVEGRLDAQRRGGLAGEVVHPDPAAVSALLSTDDPSRIVAGIESYNRWAADFAAQAPDRLVAVGMIPPTGLADAVAALQLCQGLDLPAVSLVQPPAGPGTTPLDGMDFWIAAGDCTVIGLAPNFGDPQTVPHAVPTVAAGRAPTVAGVLLRLAYSGVLDDVAGLRFVLVNQEAGWLPYALAGADTNYMRTASSRAVSLRDPDALPSEYVRRVTWTTFHADRFTVVHRDYVGEAHLMWTAALPSLLSDWPSDEEGAARVCEGLPDDATTRLLNENCRRLFGVGGAPPFTVDESDDFRHPVFA
jgi:hypothetical protein